MSSPPRVALLVETSGGYGRDVLAGVAHYARIHGPWSFYVLPRGHEQKLPDMTLWRGTGIIARIESPHVADTLAQAGVPVIGLDAAPATTKPLRSAGTYHEVHANHDTIARLAAEHLLERGFQSFGFVGVKDELWAKARETAFLNFVHGQHGWPCPIFNLSERTRARKYGRDQEHLCRWLQKLPKPAALMACNDDCGREVLDAAFTAGLSVPDDLAVIGVDNDEVLCALCNPPLSSVNPNARRTGYEAAALLHQLMRGEAPAGEVHLVEPTEVATRQSTDVVAIGDAHVAKAVRLIRQQACQPGLSLDHLLRAIPLSRTVLERRFKRCLGHTPHEHLQRTKIARVKELLATTDLSMSQIADLTGFQHIEYLSVAFKRQTGLAPSHYRKQRALRSD